MENSTTQSVGLAREKAIEMMKVYLGSIRGIRSLIPKAETSVIFEMTATFISYVFWYSKEFGIPLEEVGSDEGELRSILTTNLKVELTPKETEDFWKPIREGIKPEEIGSVTIKLKRGKNGIT